MNIALGPIALVEELNARRALYEIDARDTASDRPISILVECLRADLEGTLGIVRECSVTLGNAWESICGQAVALLQTDPTPGEQFLYHATGTRLNTVTPAELLLVEIAMVFDDSHQLESFHLDCRLRGVLARIYVEDDLSVLDIDFGD